MSNKLKRINIRKWYGKIVFDTFFEEECTSLPDVPLDLKKIIWSYYFVINIADLWHNLENLYIHSGMIDGNWYSDDRYNVRRTKQISELERLLLWEICFQNSSNSLYINRILFNWCQPKLYPRFRDNLKYSIEQIIIYDNDEQLDIFLHYIYADELLHFQHDASYMKSAKFYHVNELYDDFMNLLISVCKYSAIKCFSSLIEFPNCDIFDKKFAEIFWKRAFISNWKINKDAKCLFKTIYYHYKDVRFCSKIITFLETLNVSFDCSKIINFLVEKDASIYLLKILENNWCRNDIFEHINKKKLKNKCLQIYENRKNASNMFNANYDSLITLDDWYENS